MEVAIAALCFAVSLLGLLQYHQLQQQAFAYQAQQRQAWRLAYEQLSIAATGFGDSASSLASQALPQGWQLDLTQQTQAGTCRYMASTAIAPSGYQAQLRRWFC